MNCLGSAFNLVLLNYVTAKVRRFIIHIKTTAGKIYCATPVKSVFFQLIKTEAVSILLKNAQITISQPCK